MTRGFLRMALSGTAGPYGYTLAIWTSGSQLVRTDGLPDLIDAFAFAGGGVLAFALLAAAAHGATAPITKGGGMPLLASLHVPSIATALLLSYWCASTLTGVEMWMSAGAAITAGYVVMLVGQLRFVYWLRHRGARRSPSES